MSRFLREFFRPVTIEGQMIDSLIDTLNVISEDHLNIILKSQGLNEDVKRNDLCEFLPQAFEKDLKSLDGNLIKAFNDIYRGITDYTKDETYIILKKFTDKGYIFIYTNNDGKYFNYRIPDEICQVFEKLLRL